VAPSPKKQKAALRVPFILERQRRACRHGNGSGHGADDGHDVQAKIAHMHVPIPAPGEPAHATHVLRENLARLHAANQEQREIPMRRE
jgi:hypothetical protein